MPSPHEAGAWSAFLAALTGKRLAWAVGLGAVVALALSPVFITPLPVLLGRTLFLALVLLLAFTAAGQWSGRWLPRWVAQVAAVVVAAPAATLVVYLLSVGGNLSKLVGNEARVAGFIWIAGTGLVLGLVVALGALVRERDALTRSQALQFELERSTLARQALDARVSLLQAQIEPHFLFNTLANVQALVESGSPRAAPVLRSLIAYLRAATPRIKDGQANLGDEIALVQAYLELMHMRMPDRLQFTVNVPSDLRGVRFPSMALLTLVENAVRHGVDPSEEGGRIDVGAAQTGKRLSVWVADTGVGMSDTAVPGTGLTNLEARLRASYGESALLQLSEQEPHGLRAELIFDWPSSH